VSKLARRLRHVRNLAALPDPTSPSLIERVNYLPPVSPGRDSAITDFTDFPGVTELYLPREGTSILLCDELSRNAFRDNRRVARNREGRPASAVSGIRAALANEGSPGSCTKSRLRRAGSRGCRGRSRASLEKDHVAPAARTSPGRRVGLIRYCRSVARGPRAGQRHIFSLVLSAPAGADRSLFSGNAHDATPANASGEITAAAAMAKDGRWRRSLRGLASAGRARKSRGSGNQTGET